MKLKKNTWILIFVFAIGLFFRLYQVTVHDSYTDEAILAFRAVGMVDYDASQSQTSVWQWFPKLAWWMHLSFSDHPLGFFFLQHLTMGLFGENLFGVRLPAILSGMAAMWLVYLLAKKCWDQETGIAAVAIMAVNSYSLWASRLGIQDGVVTAIMLLCLWCLFKTKEDKRYWLVLGVVFGLGIITKYTILIVIPITLLYLTVYRLPLWREVWAWYGVAAVIVCSSPSWLYNVFLYRATGHFDFQISAALHENVPQWSFRLGREEVGGLMSRFSNFFLALHYALSPLFLAAIVLALGFLVWLIIQKRNRELVFLLGATFLMYLWFFVIGSTYRFVIMIVPLLMLLLAAAWTVAGRILFQKYRGALPIIGFIFLAVESLFSLNTFFVLHPWGRENIAYAEVRTEEENYGFNQLQTYLDKRLSGKMSALVGTPQYPFLTDLVNRRLAEKKAIGLLPEATMIVYDKDINFVAGLWYVQKLLIYDGWPVIADVDFMKLTKNDWESFYRKQGVAHFVYIAAASDAVKRLPAERIGSSDAFKKHLQTFGIVPTLIKNAAGASAFLVYEW